MAGYVLSLWYNGWAAPRGYTRPLVKKSLKNREEMDYGKTQEESKW